MKIIHFLYDSELLDEQVIIKWYRLPADTTMLESDDEEEAENKHKEVRKLVKFIIIGLIHVFLVTIRRGPKIV